MRQLGPGEAYIRDSWSTAYHTRHCGNIEQMNDPQVAKVDDLPPRYAECQNCIAMADAAGPTPIVPLMVACPCGNGYAERRDQPIVEKVKGTWGQRRVTHSYRHDGCPVGGHIVVLAGRISVKAGPLFHADSYSRRAIEGTGRTVLADGGTEGEEVCPDGGAR